MVARSAAIYLGVVQFFFATTWTIYVIYLPQLAAQAGIAREWVPWIIAADQLIFAVADVLTGFWVDLSLIHI
jgi:MFS family permease